MNKSIHPLTKTLLVLTLIGCCIQNTLGGDDNRGVIQFTPTLYRAINLNGAAITVDGNNWQASSGASNFSYTQSGGGTFANQSITLVPTTDANRATMIRSCIYGNTVNLNVSAVPTGYYDIYLYVWEDNNPETFSVAIEGTVVQSNYNSGSAGTWNKLGPFRTNITDGTINVTSTGGHANLSGIEIWTADGPLTIPVTSVTVAPTSLQITPGQIAQLTRTVAPVNATNPNVNWSSSNTSIATVDANGMVTAVATGNATITATSVSGGLTATTAVTVLTAGSNLLENPEFDEGTSGWQLQDFSGVSNPWSVVTNAGLSGSNAIFVDVVSNSNTSWHIQVKQILKFKLKSGRTYAIRFMGKAQSSRNITVALRGDGSNSDYWNSNVALTTSAQSFNLTFPFVSAENPNETTFSLAFYLARGVVSDVWLDKVIVEDITGITPVTGINIAPTALNLDVSASGQLTPTIAPSNATNQNIIWTSSNPAVATVNNTGLVTGVSSGTATITGTTQNGGRTTSSTVSVGINIPVASVTVSPTSLQLTPGQLAQITSVIAPVNATNSNVNWSSSNTSIATVDASGMVTAIAPGSATITATSVSGGITATSALTVLPAGSNVLENPEFDEGTSGWQLQDFSGVSNPWSVVTDAGLSGTNAIYVDVVSNSNTSWHIQVKQVLKFKLKSGRTYAIRFMGKAQSARNIFVALRGDGSNSDYWNSNVALTTAAQSFNLTFPFVSADNPNETTFSLAFYLARGVVSDVWLDKVIVEDITGITPVTAVSVSPATNSINTGATWQLTTTITPANATNQNISWTSGNPAVATVNSSGLVTALSAGIAVITATTQNGGRTATSTVTVTGVAVTGVSVTPSALSLTAGQTSQLTRTISPANATNQDVNWSSNNTAVATVNSSGVVTAVTPGVATITATTVDGAFTGQAQVSVEEVNESSIFDKFAFQYKYDSRKRMTHKKVPGADWVYMVYDDRDRLVLTQDGVHRAKSPREWTFTKYDALNRPVLTGIYKDVDNNDQVDMQAVVNTFYDNTNEWFEATGEVVHGYTNQSFPLVSSENQYLTVNYYDNYTFKELIGQNTTTYDYDNSRLVASGDDDGQEDQAFDRVLGQVTGTRIKNLETNEWMWSVNYYDDRYRNIQVIAQNHKGGLDKVTNVYDFVGKVLRTKTDHSVAGVSPVATTRKLTYDHAGRLLEIEHSTTTTTTNTNNTTTVVIAKNEYNELGQLVTKKLHEGGNGFIQHVDYRYNIRGWLTRINNSDLNELDGGPKDFFGMELGYNTDIGVGGSSLQYNGNISAIKYSTNQGLGLNVAGDDPILEATERGYAFAYDPMNRLQEAAHREKTLSWNATTAYREGGFQYDLNGNILNLIRTGKEGADMDDLSYHYDGNRLMHVTDATNAEEGFKDGNTVGDDYIYDANGNMIADKNKNIANIQYNHLNLPSIVTKTTGEHINYIYNAGGIKVSQEVYDASDVLQKKTDYVGEFFYENDTLKFVSHEEGRVVMTGTDPEYQYTLKDHLGNSRITFTSKHEVETFTATMDPDTEQEDRNTFGSYNSYINQSLDPTPAESTTDEILILNGSTLTGPNNGQVGLTKSFSVVPGDIVSASVNAKYSEISNGPGNVAGFAAALTQAFGFLPGSPPIEGISPFEALNAFGTFISTGGRDGEESLPQGYITILVFDKDHNFVDLAYAQVGTSVNLSISLTIRQAGYAYVFLSNDGATEQQIGFDNYSVTHEHSDVIQQDDYYPFGLTFNSYQRESSLKQKFKFQSQEHVDDLGLNWDSFKWRNHDPGIGRFFNVDPLAEKYYYNSPYAFSENKVVGHRELEGLESQSINPEKKDGVNVSPSGPDAGTNAKGEVYAHVAKLNVDVVDKKNDSGEINIEATALGAKAKTEGSLDKNGVKAEGEASATTLGVAVQGRLGSERNNFTMGFSVDGPSADANAAFTIHSKEGVKVGVGSMGQLSKQTATLSFSIAGFEFKVTGTALQGAAGGTAEVHGNSKGFGAKVALAPVVGGLGLSFDFKNKN